MIFKTKFKLLNLKTILIIIAVFGVLIIAGCTTKTTTQEKNAKSWKDIELKNINSGENFKISDFNGKTVLFETFAVWCVNCKQQQDELKKLKNMIGDEDVVFVSLNSDPNEEEDQVLKYVKKNNYTWNYAIATPEMSNKLLEEFGFQIVNAPSAPIILVCKDGSYSLLPEGHKTAENLKEYLKLGC